MILDLRVGENDHPFNPGVVIRKNQTSERQENLISTPLAGNEIVGHKAPGRKLTVTLKANRLHEILSCPHLMAPLDGDIF